MFNIAPCAVSAARAIIAIFGCHILTSLLHRTLDTEALHILVGRDLGVDMMALENQRQRHSQHKEADCAHRYQNYRYYTTHI